MGANSFADWRERASHFHKLRGAAGTLGAKRITRLAGDAELACRGGDVSQIELILPMLSEELAGLYRSSADFLAAARSPRERECVSGLGATLSRQMRNPDWRLAAESTITAAPNVHKGDVHAQCRRASRQFATESICAASLPAAPNAARLTTR